MGNGELKYRINTGKMQYKREWEILCLLAENLQKVCIPFKVDGKTLIFAHGLEIPLNKICLTFRWKNEEDVKEFFHTNTSAQQIGVPVQSLEFYYENAEKGSEYYKMVEGALKKNEG